MTIKKISPTIAIILTILSTFMAIIMGSVILEFVKVDFSDNDMWIAGLVIAIISALGIGSVVISKQDILFSNLRILLVFLGLALAAGLLILASY
jgi:hypothetical protein